MNKKYIWLSLLILVAFGIGFTMSRSENTPVEKSTDNTSSSTRDDNKSLDVSGRQLTNLSDEILSQTNLTSLNLSNNQLTTLPDGIANLTRLETLNVENNRLEHAPEALKRMTWLKSLDISNNRIPAEEITELKASLPDTQIKS